jgi:hypothetical protein
MVVVAKNSDGAREASRNSPKGYELFDSVDEAVYKILCILEDFSENTDRAEWVQVQKDLDEMNLRKLFESWVKA